MSAATLIVIAGYSTSAKTAVASMCVGVALSGLMHSGYEVNILDIAPGVSGIVMGIANTAGTVTGFLSPLLVGIMTEDKVGFEYHICFTMYCLNHMYHDKYNHMPYISPSTLIFEIAWISKIVIMLCVINFG